MSSPAPCADQSNTKTDDETTAVRKKRSRRVSFAESTSVHIFDRDDESATPPNSVSCNSPTEELGFGDRDSDSRQFFRNGYDDDGPDSPFIRVVGSPSSGGSTTAGSATSNDDDTLFGPVLTNFIRPDLSHSAVSDDNHDQTMDSTAFSMHFRSIARSETDEDLKTSTSVHFSIEEKTPTQLSMPSNTSPMLLTLVKKPNSQPDDSTFKLNSGSESNGMSLDREYEKYDYGKIPPEMNAFLKEGDLDVQMASHSSVLKSPIKAGKQFLTNTENGSDLMDFSYGQDNKMEGITSPEELNRVVSVKDIGIGVADDGSKLFPSKQTVFGDLANTFDTQDSKPLTPNQSFQGTLTAKETMQDDFGYNSSLEFLATSHGTPSNIRDIVYQLDNVSQKENKTLSIGSLTHQIDKPTHTFSNGVSLLKSPGTVTPSHNQVSAFPRTASLQHGDSVSSLHRSISKLQILNTSPFSAALTAKLKDSSSRTSAGVSKMTSLGSLLEKSNISQNMDHSKIQIPRNYVPITSAENYVELASQSVLPSEMRTAEHMQTIFLKSADIRDGYKDDENETDSSQTSFHSSKELKREMLRVNPYIEERQSIQQTWSSKSGQGHVGGLGERISNTRISTPLNVAGSNIVEMVHDRKDYLYDVLSNSETKGNLTALSNDIEHENPRSVFRGSDIGMGRLKTSLVLNGRRDEFCCQKNLADEFGKSPSNKEDAQSSRPNRLSNANVNSAERKRKTEDVAIDKNAKIKRSSDFGLELSSDCEMSSIGPNQIHTRILKETKLLSHSVEKLNLHAIDRLVDIISQLQRSKTYQLLFNEIQNPSSDIRQKRAAEIKLLLCKLVHEQAKSQLLHVKRESLLKNAQSVASGIQESESLKLKLKLKRNHSSQNSLDVQAINKQPLANEDIQECQADNDEVNSLKQTVEDMNMRISNLTKSFHVLCTMKGAPSPGDTIAFVNNQLLKRARCQIIRKDLQLWIVEDLKSSKDHHVVVLNYIDLVFQRLTVTGAVVPSIFVSNTLNEINIKKNFKDMDALTAFGFVIDSGPVQKCVGATILSLETQSTSHLLGNLVDVMEEIQLARMELNNLIYARFCRPLGGCLNLELHFFDSNSRKRATVTLNTSCLNRGIYPSDIVACQIDIPVVESQHSSAQKLSAEISAAVEDLRMGFYRILRVCRCVSHLVSLQDNK